MNKKYLLIIVLLAVFGAAGPFAAMFQVEADDPPIEEFVTVTSICSGTAVPAGWAVVDITAESGRCGVTTQPIPQIWNVWYIENLNPLPNGAIRTICRPQTPPTGWIVRDVGSGSFICGVNTNSIPQIFNLQVIERVSGGPTPTPTPVTPTPNQLPIGNFDTLNDGTALGWALDKDSPGTNVRVHFYVDGPAGTGAFVGEVRTYIPRPDVNTATGYQGNHGFSFPIPRTYYDGQVHNLRAYALDNTTGNTLLTGSPKSFQLFSGSPMGKFESVGGDRVLRGWSLDPSNPNASNTVHFYMDGPAGQGTFAGAAVANIPRPDINTSTGLPGNHGFTFTIPTQYQNGANHVVYVYGLDNNSEPNILLTDSPKAFNFSPIVLSRTAYDYNGDGLADQTVYRNGVWYVNTSPANTTVIFNFGLAGDKVTPGDYDGDGKSDLAIFRNDNNAGVWWIYKSGTNQAAPAAFGYGTDTPVQADYDGDGKTDIAIFRNDNNVGIWWILRSSDGQATPIQFGVGTDVPVPADYDGDGKADLAITRQTSSGLVWLIQRSTDGLLGIQFGINSDIPVRADYDGDGKADIAVYRDGVWYIQRSRDGFTAIQFGVAGDTPVQSDHDGDGKADPSIYRNSNNAGIWWILKSSNNSTVAFQYGLGTDIPVNGK
jgi:(2Fe-2S) ferredoxin